MKIKLISDKRKLRIHHQLVIKMLKAVLEAEGKLHSLEGITVDL